MARRAAAAAAAGAFAAGFTAAGARPTAPLHEFLSRPDLQVPRLTVDLHNASAVAPGFIFLSPYYPELNPWSPIASDFEHTVNFHAGPMMFDNQGDLVWAGLNLTGADQPPEVVFGTMGFERCDLAGVPHLCYVHWHPNEPIHRDVLNQHYEVVKTVQLIGNDGSLPLTNDTHEFIIKELPVADAPSAQRQTAIITGNSNRELNPPEYHPRCNITVSWVFTSVFQEVDLQTNEVLFQWDSLDHIPLIDSHCPGNDGFWRGGDIPELSFDHFHLNSIDKDAHGDYYLSGRHTSTLYKVSGENGSIIWQLGEHGNFQLDSEVPGIPAQFGFQHHLRLHENHPESNLTANRIVLSMYDNANDHYDFVGKTSDFSSGKIYVIDEDARTATLKEAYTLRLQPDHQLSTNQGSFQLLPNGNRLLGGGNIQEVIEWQPGNFEPVFLAHWGDWELPDGSIGHKINSYRSFRFEWVGRPRDAPAIFSFASDCGSAITNYVSWNGATEVASWEIYGGMTRKGTFRQIGSMERTGFESHVPSPFANYVVAVALDGKGRELGRSPPARVAVPNRLGQSECSAERCSPGFDYAGLASRVCAPASLPAGAMALQAPLRPPWLEEHCDPCFPALQEMAAS